jgi:hypothetical protein
MNDSAGVPGLGTRSTPGLGQQFGRQGRKDGRSQTVRKKLTPIDEPPADSCCSDQATVLSVPQPPRLSLPAETEVRKQLLVLRHSRCQLRSQSAETWTEQDPK